jgi:hypothetical protein
VTAISIEEKTRGFSLVSAITKKKKKKKTFHALYIQLHEDIGVSV